MDVRCNGSDKKRAAVDENCETGTMAIDGEKDVGVKRGERNTLSVDFGFTTQSHEHSGQNKFGELLSMPLLTTKIERFKKPSVQLDNSSKQSDTFVSGANSTSVEGGISELKHVAGRILSKMQRGMDGLQEKYRDEMFMMDEGRNPKYAALLSAECGLDSNAMFRFEALTVAVVRIGCDKLRNHVDAQNDWRHGYNVTAVWSFLMQDNDGHVVRISFIGYTRACCGNQHEKEQLYGIRLKEDVKRFMEEESDHLKIYLRSVNFTRNVSMERRMYYDYRDFVVSIRGEEQFQRIQAMANKMGYYSSFIFLIRKLIEKLHLTRSHAIKLLYISGLCNGQCRFYEICSSWLNDNADGWNERDKCGSLVRFYFQCCNGNYASKNPRCSTFLNWGTPGEAIVNGDGGIHYSTNSPAKLVEDIAVIAGILRDAEEDEENKVLMEDGKWKKCDTESFLNRYRTVFGIGVFALQSLFPISVGIGLVEIADRSVFA